jgi:hypothetical protein
MVGIANKLHMRRTASAALFAVVGVLAVSALESGVIIRPAFAEFAPAEFSSDIPRVLRSRDFQTEIQDLEPGSGASGRTPPKMELGGEPTVQPEIPNISFGNSELARILLWLLAAVGGGFLVYLLAREFMARRKSLTKKVVDEIDSSNPVTDKNDQGDCNLAKVQALAADGRLAEAVHLLLTMSLELLRRRDGVPVSRSMTSREVILKSQVPEAPRSALARIVRTVELSYFGGRDPDQVSFQSCVDDYRFLARDRGMPPGGAAP